MKRRKTAILLALALSVTAVFTACGGSSQGGSSQGKAEEQTEAAEQADASDAEQAEAADQTQADAAAAEPAQAAAEADQATDTAAAEQAQPAALAAPAQGSQPAALAAPAVPAADKFHVELEEVGRFSGKNDYRVTYDSIVHNEGDHVTFCDFNGNPVSATTALRAH